MNNEHIDACREEMSAVIEVVGEDLSTIKTGRARPDFIAQVQVESYGTRMPLIELANITTPDPQLLVVTPWDESVIENIEKAIASSDLNLSPVVDGNIIRIAIPALTEERREEMVKLVKQKLESGRVLLRQARQETKRNIEGMKGESGVSEDDIHLLLGELDKLMEEYSKKIERLGEVKEEELRTI